MSPRQARLAQKDDCSIRCPWCGNEVARVNLLGMRRHVAFEAGWVRRPSDQVWHWPDRFRTRKRLGFRPGFRQPARGEHPGEHLVGEMLYLDTLPAQVECPTCSRSCSVLIMFTAEALRVEPFDGQLRLAIKGRRLPPGFIGATVERSVPATAAISNGEPALGVSD